MSSRGSPCKFFQLIHYKICSAGGWDEGEDEARQGKEVEKRERRWERASRGEEGEGRGEEMMKGKFK